MIPTTMSDIDRESLELRITKYIQTTHPSEKREWKQFELFCANLILVDEEITYEEIAGGNIGSGGDGGADAFYFCVNGQCVTEEADIPKEPVTAELIIIQASKGKTFEGEKIKKFKDFCEWCLDWSREVDDFANMNPIARDAVRAFRTNYKAVLADVAHLEVKCHYACRADSPPDGNTESMVGEVEKYVRAKGGSSTLFSFRFWKCQDLLVAASAAKNEDLVLDIVKSFSSHDQSVVCLARVDKFARFLTDDKNNIRLSMLEPNVRDYQGTKNQVNKDIRETLSSKSAEDFWWLNNGVTMLADDCPIFGDTVKVTRPQIVNGLQTSFEIFQSFKDSKSEDNRCVLIRIIRTTNESSRDRIIKATNYQTTVPPITLRATDPIQLDIEQILNHYGLFYDRRKGQRRREGRDASKVVTMTAMGQAVASILLQIPTEARSKPKSTLEKHYNNIFGKEFDRELFVACIMLDRAVSEFLSQIEIEETLRSSSRLYIDMVAACKIVKARTPTVKQISDAIDSFKSPPSELLVASRAIVVSEYLRLGGTENVAKTSEFSTAIKTKLDAEFGMTTPLLPQE